ncbi:MAG: ABC transporter permease [Candidatus Aenigmarchaeota archaeon]|nr:ABC transporter permease [Candidatus Aenigmarchaeota archaeon]
MSKIESGILKSITLELNHVKETRANLILLLLLPALIVTIFAFASSIAVNIPWIENAGYKTFYDYYAPGILSTIVVFIAIQLTVLRIVAERSPYGTLDRELLAISRFNMFFGKLIANIIINFIQVFIIFFIGLSIFGFYMIGNPMDFLLILLITSLVGLSIGLTFSIFSKSKEQAIQLVPFTILIFIVLSGVLIPLELMPINIRIIASNTPLALSSQSLNEISIGGSSIFNMLDEIIKMLVWVFVFTSLGLVKFMTEKR